MVFAADLDRSHNPIRTRIAGIAVGTVLLLSVTIGMVSPRTIAFSLPAIALAFIVANVSRRQLLRDVVRYDGGWAPLGVFAAYALASTAWSAKPLTTIEAPLWLAFYLTLGLLLVKLMMREPRRNAFHIAEGLWLGLLAGLIYLFVEISSGQAVKIAVFNALHVPKTWLRPAANFTWEGTKLVAIAPMDLTRSIAPVTLLLWSALLSLRATAPGQAVKLWSLTVFVLAAVVIAISGHETSKAALLASSLVFVLARRWPDWTRRLLQLGFVAACFAAVPVSLALYRLELHHAPWVQHSLQHRIVIWNHTAEAVMERPVLGVAAGMMYELAPTFAGQSPDPKFDLVVPHAHNIFLQTWFELGLVGAVLAALAGFTLLERIARFAGPEAPFGYATFAAATTMAGASYSLWQAWFLGLFALSAFCYALAVRVNRAEAVTPPAG